MQPLRPQTWRLGKAVQCATGVKDHATPRGVNIGYARHTAGRELEVEVVAVKVSIDERSADVHLLDGPASLAAHRKKSARGREVDHWSKDVGVVSALDTAVAAGDQTALCANRGAKLVLLDFVDPL